jgi:hypothetical protein
MEGHIKVEFRRYQGRGDRAGIAFFNGLPTRWQTRPKTPWPQL